MRVLRLFSPESFAVEFHPYVTVVTGLEPDQRAALLRAFEGVPRADAAGLGGLIEAHGVVLDFDEESLRLAGLGQIDVDVLVRPDDLPGSATAGVGRQLRAAVHRLGTLEEAQDRARAECDAADAAVVAAEAALTSVRRRAEAVSAPDARERLTALDEAVATFEADVDRLAAEAAEAVARHESALATLEARRQDLAAATEHLDRARTARAAAVAAVLAAAEAAASRDLDAADALRHAEAVLAELLAVGPDDPTAELTAELAAVDRELVEVVALLDALTSFDPEPVRVALEIHLGGPADVALVPSAEALALAEHLDQLLRQVADAAPVEPRSPVQLEHAEAAVADAQTALVEAERASRPAPLEAADMAALDAAHAAVLEAQDRLDRRFGAGRAAQRLSDARAAEQALLDRLGLPTWSDYVIGAGVRSTDPVLEERVAVARRNLAEAEARVTDLRHSMDVELAGAVAAESLLSARQRAHALVGPDISDDDLVDALQELRVAETGRSPVSELRVALCDVGLAVDDEAMGSDELVGIAEEWLAEASSARRESADLVDRRADLLNRRDEVGHLLRAITPTAAADTDALADARAAVEAARARVDADADARASTDVAQADTSVERADEEVDHAQEARAQMVDALTAAEDGAIAAGQHRDALAGELDAARSASEQTRVERDALAGALNEQDSATTDLDAGLVAAGNALMVAETARSRAHAQLSEASVAVRAHVEEVAALRTALVDIEDARPPTDEVEWYLLARLAAQRQVSFAGSVPLVLDDAVPRVEEAELSHVLDRLERMAGAVQVVHLTDHPAVVSWATEAGVERVAVVRPVTARVRQE